MKKVLAILAIVAISLSSCDKKGVTPNPPGGGGSGGGGGGGGQTPQTATLKLVNQSSNPYYIFVGNADKGVLSGNNSVSFTLNPGSVKVYVKQKSGYAFYPTEKEYTVTLYAGKISMLSFP